MFSGSTSQDVQKYNVAYLIIGQFKLAKIFTEDCVYVPKYMVIFWSFKTLVCKKFLIYIFLH